MSSVWPHAPTHRLLESGAYIVTGGTFKKQPFFVNDGALDALQAGLLKYARNHGWQLEAWAIFPNHYHFVAQSPQKSAENLSTFLNEFHSRSARWINGRDLATGRKVWHNFWETHLTYEKSYLARLNYVHQNAVKHGLTKVASQYRWCSAAWFERVASQSMIRTVYSFPTDTLNILDDF